jgi:PAS domain S-box-containing protein
MTPSSSASTLGHDPAASSGWRNDRWLFGAISALLLIAGIAATTFSLGLPYLRERPSAIGWVEHTYEVIGATGEFLVGLQDFETSQQSYLLARNPAVFESYNRGIDLALRSLIRLQQLTLDNPRQQDRLRGLRDLLTIVNQANAVARDGDVQYAAGMIAADNGAKLRQSIRRVMDDVAAEEQQLLQQRQAAQAELERRTAIILIGLSATAAAGLLLCGVALGMALRAARSARRDAAERQRLIGMMDLAAIMVRDFNGIIRFWSEGCCRLYGWTAAEAVGRPAHMLLQTVFPIPQPEIEARLQREAEWNGELRQKTRDGTEVIVRAWKLLCQEPNGQPALIMENVTDATPQARAEKALRENEARLRLVEEVGRIASADWTTTEQRALCSEEFRHLYGLPQQQTDITLAAWLDRVHPEDRDRVAAGILPVAEREDAVASEFRIRRDDGTVQWVAMRAVSFAAEGSKALRVISAHQDMTDLVAAREALAARRDDLERLVAERTAALAEAEARFRAIFDSQFQLISVLAPDGTTLEVNYTTLETGGLARPDVVGHKFWTAGWWPRSERERLPEEVTEAASGKMVRREAELHGANGRSIWIDYSLKPVHDVATGHVEWIIAEGHDVTERRAMAESLAQAKKMQALGQLAAGIAHDFNNILQAVSGAATMAARRPEDHERARRFAQISIDAAARGALITDRLLSFARQGDVRTEAISVSALLSNMRELLASSLGSAITVHTTLAADVPMVLADRSQIETALVNIGTKATPRNKRVGRSLEGLGDSRRAMIPIGWWDDRRETHCAAVRSGSSVA